MRMDSIENSISDLIALKTNKWSSTENSYPLEIIYKLEQKGQILKIL